MPRGVVRDQVSSVFAALADPTRRVLFDQLLKNPQGLSATELARVADVSRQAIVKHLQALVHAGLSTSHRDGREIRYVAVIDGMDHASSWLDERTLAWATRRAALEERIRRATLHPAAPER